jgi:hypothetical protein
MPIGFSLLLLFYVAPLGPIALTVAFLRYRLFDIGLIIQLTLIYGVLTILLASIFFANVTPLQILVTAVSHRTLRLRILVDFQKDRPPIQTWLVEELRRR